LKSEAEVPRNGTRCEVEVGDRRGRCRAHPATPREQPRLWALMTETYPTYNSYQAATDGEILIVVWSR
jgi:hypothetical protein